MTNRKASTARLAKMAMMAAISCALVLLIRIPFPPMAFLVYDPADIPIYITTFAFGPISGLIVTLIVSLIQAFVLGGDGIYGFIMHFLATGLFAIVAGNIYRHKKTKKEAIIAIAAGVIVMTAMMCLFNYIIDIRIGEAVAALIIPAIIPFNLLKGGINGIITFLVYKRISKFLHRGAY